MKEGEPARENEEEIFEVEKSSAEAGFAENEIAVRAQSERINADAEKGGFLSRVSSPKIRKLVASALLMMPVFALGCDSPQLKKAKQEVAQKQDELRVLEQNEIAKKLDEQIKKRKGGSGAHGRGRHTVQRHAAHLPPEEIHEKAAAARAELDGVPLPSQEVSEPGPTPEQNPEPAPHQEYKYETAAKELKEIQDLVKTNPEEAAKKLKEWETKMYGKK